MTEWQVVRHAVAVAGRVADAQTGQTIGGAQVRITAAPSVFTDRLAVRAKQYGDRWETMAERPDRTHTAVDGHFHFLDLPDGEYELTVSLPGFGTRYGTTQVEATVSRDTEDNMDIAVADVILRPTTLKGLITGQTTDDPVAMAEVRVQGSGERTFSDGQGRYCLAGLEIGSRRVLVSAQGYQQVVRRVRLGEAGKARTLNFVLTPATL